MPGSDLSVEVQKLVVCDADREVTGASSCSLCDPEMNQELLAGSAGL